MTISSWPYQPSVNCNKTWAIDLAWTQSFQLERTLTPPNRSLTPRFTAVTQNANNQNHNNAQCACVRLLTPPPLPRIKSARGGKVGARTRKRTCAAHTAVEVRADFLAPHLVDIIHRAVSEDALRHAAVFHASLNAAGHRRRKKKKTRVDSFETNFCLSWSYMEELICPSRIALNPTHSWWCVHWPRVKKNCFLRTATCTRPKLPLFFLHVCLCSAQHLHNPPQSSN